MKRTRTERTRDRPRRRGSPPTSATRPPARRSAGRGPCDPAPVSAASIRPVPSISTATPTGSSCTAPERRSPADRRLRCAAVDERTYGVAELGSVIARAVHQMFPGRCWVRGQIRNLNRSAAGHVYFELAEPGPLGAPPDAVIPVTLLASDRPTVNAVMRAAGAGRMDDGMEIRIAGRLTWLAPRGRMQLRMATIDPAYTLGRLGEDRDRLLAALAVRAAARPQPVGADAGAAAAHRPRDEPRQRRPRRLPPRAASGRASASGSSRPTPAPRASTPAAPSRSPSPGSPRTAWTWWPWCGAADRGPTSRRSTAR